MQITNFPHSFIQFCNDFAEGCSLYNNVKVPIKYSSDVNFMVLITMEGYDDAGDIAFVWANKAFDPEDAIVNADIITSPSFLKTEITAGQWLFAVNNCYTPAGFSGSSNAPDAGDCVFLTMIDTNTDTVICQANLIFEYVTDVCFTNVVRYRCADNAYGFYYEEINTYIDSLGGTQSQFFNTIRLPITINSPQPIRKKTGFKDSTGNYKTLAANFEKEWKCGTDFFNDFIHTRLTIALEHDYLFLFEEPKPTGSGVTCDNVDYSDYAYYHEEDDDYAIAWDYETPGTNLGLAQASFKLKQDPFYAQNSNC